MGASLTGETEWFAYGTNETEDGCKCPANAAGFDITADEPKPGLMRMVASYDERLDSPNEMEGKYPEQEAREAWIDALAMWRQQDVTEVVAVGEDVARSLGWLDES